MEETEGVDWQEGEILTKVNKVWDLPQYEILPCRAKDCSDTSETYQKSLDLCVDHLNNSGFTLSAFADSGKVHDAIAQTFPDSKKKPSKKEDDSNLTDFGKYFQDHKAKADSVLCFFQYHERPGTERFLDWDKKGVFSISGLPEKLLPESIGSFPDYSDEAFNAWPLTKVTFMPEYLEYYGYCLFDDEQSITFEFPEYCSYKEDILDQYGTPSEPVIIR